MFFVRFLIETGESEGHTHDAWPDGDGCEQCRANLALVEVPR